MCEERLRFIISVRNMDKCPPDYYYFCGAKSPIANLASCIERNEVLLDINPECARTINGLENAVFDYGLLKSLGFEQVQVLKKITTFENMDSETMDTMVTQSKIEGILQSLDKDDIKYLQSKGLLDLTIVT